MYPYGLEQPTTSGYHARKMRIFYALSRVFFTLGVVYHPACIWAGSPSIIQDPQGEGVWAVLVGGVQAPGPFSILGKGIEQHNKGFTMSQSLCFNEFSFTPIQHNDQPWIPARQLANALGYKDERSVHKIYERNKEEFSSMMSTVVNLTTGVMELPTRIFSLRGCHLLAMFARTPVAKAFRRWVLDVIEQYGDRVPVAHPVTLNDAPISPEQRAELKLIVDTKAGMVPKAVQRRAYKEIWTRFNRHFHIAEYKQLPCSHMDEARDFLLSMQVNAGNTVELPQMALPLPQEHECIDEKPFLEFIKDIQSAHEEVSRILSNLHHSVFTLTWKVAEALEQRADIRLYLVPDMLSENTLRGYLYQSVYHDVRKALTAPGRQLEEYSNPGYSLLGIVRQLNDR